MSNETRGNDNAAEAMNNPPTGPLTAFTNGQPRVGQSILARPNAIKDKDGIDYGTTRFQWLLTGEDGVTREIPGATGKTYTPTRDDRGQYLFLRYDFSDLKGNAESVNSLPLGMVMDDTMMKLAGLYELALLRPADGPGLVFWSDVHSDFLDAGNNSFEATLNTVALFGASDAALAEITALGERKA